MATANDLPLESGEINIRPQPRQEMFLEHPADIVIYGGSAGSGKTRALLMAPIRYLSVPGFKAVIFRKTYPLILMEGGIWDDSKNVYQPLRGEPVLGPPRWRWPNDVVISFRHLERNEDCYEYKSAQIAWIGWDQIEEMTEFQFFYMLSRNRSMCGVKPQVRASCNPDSESWLARFLAWWIDQDTGYPIPERAGLIRWMARDGENLIWGSSRAEVIAKCSPDTLPKSVAFIPALLDDNQELLRKDPTYLANLQLQTTVERERLLRGNWKIRPSAGIVFPRNAWGECQQFPAEARLVRYIDKAYTEGGTGARTASVIVGEYQKGGTKSYYIGDGRAGRWGDMERETQIKDMARSDRENYGYRAAMRIEQEPAAGKFSARFTIANLAGYDVQARPARMKKHIAWQPLASQVQAENVYIVTGQAGPNGEYVRGAQPWNHEEFRQELDKLSGDPKLDARFLRDYADAASGGFNELTEAGGAYLNRPLLCSGGDYEGGDVNQLLTEDELTGLPDILADIMRGARRDTGGAYGRD